ncbi:SPOR domain-containing protein [Yunchengibacter salinarum]|uniref:SPOR domain-containing protein n=1 Tax=Yunchengibacter salinarum TaxID=3133399 RepID=UPI0035B6A100
MAKSAHTSPAGRPAKAALVMVAALSLGACGGTTDLWQAGDEIEVKAQAQRLDNQVYAVSEDSRELKARFDALEQLYLDLARELEEQKNRIRSIRETAVQAATTANEATVREVRGEMNDIQSQMQSLENRLFGLQVSDRRRSENESGDGDGGPADTTGQGMSGFSPSMEANTGGGSGDGNGGGSGGTTGDDDGSDDTAAASSGPQFGMHLGSYRSRGQVPEAWNRMKSTFVGELQGMTPRVYVQSQEGIGTFLRLIAGPLPSEQAARAACDRIRDQQDTQYCRISEYQGEPLNESG